MCVLLPDAADTAWMWCTHHLEILLIMNLICIFSLPPTCAHFAFARFGWSTEWSRVHFSLHPIHTLYVGYVVSPNKHAYMERTSHTLELNRNGERQKVARTSWNITNQLDFSLLLLLMLMSTNQVTYSCSILHCTVTLYVNVIFLHRSVKFIVDNNK